MQRTEFQNPSSEEFPSILAESAWPHSIYHYDVVDAHCQDWCEHMDLRWDGYNCLRERTSPRSLVVKSGPIWIEVTKLKIEALVIGEIEV